jgi:hypothetical protein
MTSYRYTWAAVWFSEGVVMKRTSVELLLSVLAVVFLLAAPSSSAFAKEHLINGHWMQTPTEVHPEFPFRRRPRVPRVPELDPSLAVSGLAMLGGGFLLIADRLRNRKSDKDKK